MAGHPVPQVRPEIGAQGPGRRPGARDHVRDQRGPAGQGRPRDRDRVHARVSGEVCLDLGRVDPDPAHLELAVQPPLVGQYAVRRPAHPVAGAVPAHALGVLGEAIRGGLGKSQVAERDGGPADQQLALLADPFVHMGQGTPDRHPVARRPRPVPRGRQRSVQVDGMGDQRGLGGPVGVEQPDPPGVQGGPVGEPGRVGGLPADHQQPDALGQREALLGEVEDEFVPERGGQVQHADPLPLHHPQEARERAGVGVAVEDERGTAGEGREDLLEAGVPVQRGELQHPVLGGEAEQGAQRVHRGGDRPARCDHGFRLPGRTRGEEQVRRLLRPGPLRSVLRSGRRSGGRAR